MEERKSFVFFTSWARILKKYPPELRCEIYDALVEYAETGTTPELSDVAQMAFEFIKSEIDRTQDKYEKTCEKRRKAIQKRWQKANKNTASDTNDTNEYKCIDSIQKNKLNTNDTEDEDKDEDEDEDKDEDDTIKKNLYDGRSNNAQARETASYYDRDFLNEFFAPEKQAKLEALAMQLRLTIDDIRQMAQEIVNDWILTGKKHQTYNDASWHLIGLLRKRRRWGTLSSPATGQSPGLGVGEFRNAKGERTYASSGVIVPESAPPRPSAAHWWSDKSNLWEKQI